jgi:hypothetical protein
MGDNINSWRQTGTVFAWRYVENVENYPGWHLAFDPAGVRSFEDLLRRVAAASAGPAYRTIKVTHPTAKVLRIPNNRRSAVVAPQRLRVSGLAAEDGWSATESAGNLNFAAGRGQLLGLADWLAADRDSFDTTYGRGPEFWYWGTV